jgi:hypothetical protein
MKALTTVLRLGMFWHQEEKSHDEGSLEEDLSWSSGVKYTVREEIFSWAPSPRTLTKYIRLLYVNIMTALFAVFLSVAFICYLNFAATVQDTTSTIYRILHASAVHVNAADDDSQIVMRFDPNEYIRSNANSQKYTEWLTARNEGKSSEDQFRLFDMSMTKDMFMHWAISYYLSNNYAFSVFAWVTIALVGMVVNFYGVPIFRNPNRAEYNDQEFSLSNLIMVLCDGAGFVAFAMVAIYNQAYLSESSYDVVGNPTEACKVVVYGESTKGTSFICWYGKFGTFSSESEYNKEAMVTNRIYYRGEVHSAIVGVGIAYLLFGLVTYAWQITKPSWLTSLSQWCASSFARLIGSQEPSAPADKVEEETRTLASRLRSRLRYTISWILVISFTAFSYVFVKQVGDHGWVMEWVLFLFCVVAKTIQVLVEHKNNTTWDELQGLSKTWSFTPSNLHVYDQVVYSDVDTWQQIRNAFNIFLPFLTCIALVVVIWVSYEMP